METQFNNALEYLKTLEDIDGCITGSSMIGYMEGQKQDIDVFCYSQASFIKLLYTLHFNPMFLILDKVEQWKFSDYTKSAYNGSIKKFGLITIKMTYNLSVEVNIIFKEKANNIFSILASFDMSIICKAYDLKTKKYLDLSEGTIETKIVKWNRWNNSYYDVSPWSLSRICRQLTRVKKYQNRGFELTEMLLKYKEVINNMIFYENIFDSVKVAEKVDTIKHNGKILIEILDLWLEKGTITDKEEELLIQTVKLI